MAPAVGTAVWLVRRKWPDSQHYEVAGKVLGSDEHGVWVGALPGSLVRMRDGGLVKGEHAVVWCVPHDGWYFVHVLGSQDSDVAVYIDICTPPVWADDRATMIDLDLDIVTWRPSRGGHTELVDEDEFEEHMVSLDYPDHLIDGARRSADTVMERLKAGESPFVETAAAPWFALLGA